MCGLYAVTWIREKNRMSSKERIMDAVDKAYHGLPVEYHKRLGERLASAITNAIIEVDIEEALSRIKYHGDQVKSIYHNQFEPASP